MKQKNRLIILCWAYLYALCSCQLISSKQNKDKIEPERNFQKMTVGKKAMIVTAHPLASKAGIEIMQMGGNAIDAAVTSSFVTAVVRPQSTGIGGGGFLLFYDKNQDETKVFDFRERAPLRSDRNMFLTPKGLQKPFIFKEKSIPNASINGHLAVGVPGFVAGMYDVHHRYGKLPWKKVLAPAIHIAEAGFPVYHSLRQSIIRRQDVIKNFLSTQTIFLPNQSPLKENELLVQKDLAETLKIIADKGKDGFYQGIVRDNILAEIEKGGGILKKEDFDDYKTKELQPLIGSYRDHKIVSMPPPSSGGIHILQMLNIIEHENLKPSEADSVKSLHLIAEAMKRAFADRAKYLGDPDFVDVPVKGLASKKYAKSLYESIDFQSSTPSQSIAFNSPFLYESDFTTHISIVDPDGYAVSTTHTINQLFGSCVVADKTGIILNNEMDDFSTRPGQPNGFGLVGSEANAIVPKKTMLSSMSPTFVFDKNNKLKLVIGSPGGPRIITSVLQVIINSLDYKMPLLKAVNKDRIHHQWLPDELHMEQKFTSEKTIRELKSIGHQIKIADEPLGDVQAIEQAGNEWIGVSDYRSDGDPVGF